MSEDETVVAGGSDRHGQTTPMIGRYRVESVLGEGAMGVVYKAFDPSIQRNVAIKTIRTELLDDEVGAEFIARFRREAQAAGRVVHPNLVTVFEIGEHDGMPFLAMEYVDGRELKALFRGGALDLELTRRIFSQVLQGLEVAHGYGVVHRDIKPQNIFVQSDGVTKVSDFGIAHLDSTNITKTGTFFGTPSYMSPEQFTGSPVDRRSDLYAAGALLYEMVAGVKAFPGGSVTEVMYAVLEKEPTDLPTLRMRLPPALVRVISKSLEKRPEDRFQDAEEFRLAFEAACDQALAGGVGGVGSLLSGERLTSYALATLPIGLGRFQDDLVPLVSLRLSRHLAAKPARLVLESARRRLDYDEMVRLLKALRTDSDQCRLVFTLANELSEASAEAAELARLDHSLATLTRTSAPGAHR